MSDNDDNDENAQRRDDEWEALQAVYEGDECISLFQQQPEQNDKTMSIIWTIQLHRTRLQFTLPAGYPSQQAPQHVTVYAPHVAAARLTEIQIELQDLWTPDTEVALLWTEHVRQAVSVEDCDEQAAEPETDQKTLTDTHNMTAKINKTITFVPPTAKFGQPVRTFDAAIVMNNAQFAIPIFQGPVRFQICSYPRICIVQLHKNFMVTDDPQRDVPGSTNLNGHAKAAYRLKLDGIPTHRHTERNETG